MITEFDNIKMWLPLDDIEPDTLKQVKATATHPLLFKHIAIMPDAHWGIGCSIGTVLPINGAVIPAAVGVDIGCGMVACRTSLTVQDIEDHFETLHDAISKRIPVGFNHRSNKQMFDADAYLACNSDLSEAIESQQKNCKKPIAPQLGTLGGGNHFIELQSDPDGQVWIMIHSGSRNIGLTIAQNNIDLAKDLGHGVHVPDGLEYLPVSTPEGQEYIKNMTFALNFAQANRDVMFRIIIDELVAIHPSTTTSFVVNIHHNYVANENHHGDTPWVHRKGATSAMSGQLGIIPGSMGTNSYIVRGKGAPESFCSCSHGAGRTMSRTKARGKFNRKTGKLKSRGVLRMDDFESDMKNVFSRGVESIKLDEAPRAYKDIGTVMERQSDLVDIVVELTPIFNMKG